MENKKQYALLIGTAVIDGMTFDNKFGNKAYTVSDLLGKGVALETVKGLGQMYVDKLTNLKKPQFGDTISTSDLNYRIKLENSVNVLNIIYSLRKSNIENEAKLREEKAKAQRELNMLQSVDAKAKTKEAAKMSSKDRDARIAELQAKLK